jgi:hypothetical protein
MKKAFCKWGLVGLVVIALLCGSVATVSALSSPSITVSNQGSGFFNVVGKNFAAGPVDLFVDTIDDAHHVTVATPNTTGLFYVSFPLATTFFGMHQMIAVQAPSTTVTVAFNVPSVPPVDDRIYSILQSTDEETTNIEQKLDGTRQSVITDIDDNLDIVKNRIINRVAKVVSDVQNQNLTTNGTRNNYWGETYTDVMHVSVTILTKNMNDGDQVTLNVFFGGNSAPLAVITTNGISVYQFDAKHWNLDVNVGSAPLGIAWQYTATGPGWVVAPD